MDKRRFYFDLAERVLWTFVQAFCAVWIVSGGLGTVDGGMVSISLDLDKLFSLFSLKVAGAAGLISVAKCLIATKIGGDSSSAATLPEAAQE